MELRDLDELRSCDALLLHGLFETFGDEESHTPAPGTENVGVAHLARVDAHAGNDSVLPHLIGVSVLRTPVAHLFAARIIDAADDAKRIEDEVGIGQALHLGG